MSRAQQVKRQQQQRLEQRAAEQQLRDMTIVERNRRGREVSREEPLPYGSLPPSAANTPGFVVGMPVEAPSTAQRPVTQPPATGLSDDVSARESALTAMRQQYAPGSQVFETEAGKEMIQSASTNQYSGDQAGLAEFNMNQRKVGIGAIDEIIDALGYAGTPMEDWARANENLALREYNKAFGNSYAGTGPSDEEIKVAMESGQYFPSEGSPNPLGKTGEARESNMAQVAAVQQNQERPFVAEESEPKLRGKDLMNMYKNRVYGVK